MALNNERLARAIQTLITTGLPAALDAVEALWTGATAVVLANPASVFLGHKPTLLEMPSTAFPIICIITPNREPQAARAWGYQEQTVTVYLDYFVVAEDEATVNLRTWRYAEALVTLMQANRVVGGLDQTDYEPQVLFSEASRHGKTSDADMFETAQVDFIQGGRIMLRFEDS